ncbi:arginase family protein [Chondromyces apiculatus]|uniref:Guanidinobutyrase n=1 Tax=Chondromyces apiculatus DSM 436 TaxID=1192034 RepID=A0A017T5E4_9BACT|nr:arginase family protein [Chondromyces apiculatus]EYF04222.1 Guanidinobutyrase [Chondromyces apiculatus DSM 436]
MLPREELALLLRPAAGGLYVVSTGRAEQLAMQQQLYRADSAAEVQSRWLESLERIQTARVILLGVPSDVGAGYRRGANLAPQFIRSTLLETHPEFPDWAASAGVVDIGDVFVVPQLLHDDMLSEAQKEATRRALYPELSPEEAAALPVSPLSITERALDLVFQLNPGVAPIVLGGDHSTALPVARALARARREPWGIVQPDAHTDLLEERLGIRDCFATWSYHANELLGRGGRLTQVGTRASRFGRAHWESRYDVRQFWASECLADPAAALDAILAHVRSTGVRGVYFSNDIDGTDDTFADATGTPEPAGLHPDFVVELIRRLGREVGLIGGDVMEVAPMLGRTSEGNRVTLALAVRYLRETLEATLGQRLA